MIVDDAFGAGRGAGGVVYADGVPFGFRASGLEAGVSGGQEGLVVVSAGGRVGGGGGVGVGNQN